MSEALTPHLSREQYRRGYLLNMGKKISNEAYNLSAVETYLSQGESAADAINDSATLTQGIPLATLKAINAVKYREVVENSTAAVQPLALREQQFIYAGSDGLTSLLRSMMQNGKKVPQYLFRQIINDVMSQASGTRPTAIDPLVQMAGVNSPTEENNADGQATIPNTAVDPRVNQQDGSVSATAGDRSRSQQTDFRDTHGNEDDESSEGEYWDPEGASSEEEYEDAVDGRDDESGSERELDPSEYSFGDPNKEIYHHPDIGYYQEATDSEEEEDGVQDAHDFARLQDPTTKRRCEEDDYEVPTMYKYFKQGPKKQKRQGADCVGKPSGGRLIGRNSVPTGVEHMYQRSIRGSGLAAPGKKKKVVAAKKPLAPFGRYTIDLQDLKDNKLALYTTKGNKQRRIPTSVVGGSVANVLKSIVVGKRPKPKDILTLDDTEKEYLAGIGTAAKIEDLEDMPTKKKTELQKELHEFEVIRGQIGAGNDNPELVKKFKTSLVKLVRAKKVNSKQANDILLELADLGH